MNTLPELYVGEPTEKKKPWWMRSARYLWLAVLSYTAIGVIVLMYMMKTPIYSSAFSLVLPGSGSSSSFNIENVGQANQSTRTPFGSHEFSPLVNYKEIIKSRDVIELVANYLNVSRAHVSVPRVELRERTSIINIHVEGLSPQRSQELGWAYYKAFQEVLSNLRSDELKRRDESIERVLDDYRDNLFEKRNAIVEFQQRALLVSGKQLDQLMHTIASVREKEMVLTTQARNTEDFVRQLSLDLGISPALAGHAFRLQSDAEYRSYLRELDSSAMKISEYSSRWGKQHPKVVAQTLRYESAIESLYSRSTELVGAPVADAIHTTDLQSSPQRADLFAKLVDSFAQLQGVEAEISELTLISRRLDDQLKVFSRESAELGQLEREFSLAEAVFTSAAAKLEAGKADVFGSYPVVQLLSVPSVPEKPKNPNPKIAVAVAALGLLSVSFGLFVLWHRAYLIRLVLKNG